MTGGSLPAMVWHRLMTYAHENVDLKPIPGIDNPFVDAQEIAKLEEKQKKQKKKQEEDSSFSDIERRPVLSGVDHKGAARASPTSSRIRPSSTPRPSPRHFPRSRADSRTSAPACHPAARRAIRGGSS